ncbi:(2,3-dihydroxybenzoyl)adenylate synthase [Pseudomonas fuscovaginae]|uniref:Pyochelin synthase PchD n=1 Tax=Pseudomonas asplenii TaxID=53407 RepID=A0A0N0E1C8_9PSED|nr:AMP-binding protein [Pseudomonas fuscovaginae]KPA87547.1 peptide arylation enzyme [Pseudomonas fuscovaginae]
MHQNLSELRAQCVAPPAGLASEYRRLPYWQELSLGQMLKAQAERHGERPALVDGERCLSYRQLYEGVERLATALWSRGLRPGQVAIVQLNNQAAVVELVFALFRLGVVPVMALPAHGEREIGQFVGLTDAVAWFHPQYPHDSARQAVVERIRIGSPSLRLVVAVEPQESWRDLMAGQDTAATIAQPSPDDIACFQLSGGTTGIPKLIPRRHNEYLYNAHASAHVSGLDSDSRQLAVLPMAHNFPMASPGFIGTLSVGGCVVIARDPSPIECFELIEAHGVTHVSLVPTLVLLWLEAAQELAPVLDSLQVLQVGGASFAEDVARRVEPTLGCRLQQVFGMAEGLLSFTRLDDPLDRVCTTQGRPLSPADEVLIVDDQDRELPVGEKGHLLVRGPYTLRAYYGAPEHNRHAFRADGFYRTGDLARRDAEGYLRLCGRDKEQINRGGEKIAVDEVESVLISHPSIYDAAVVGLPDEYLGEKSCAFIILRQPMESREIGDFLQQQGLASFKQPDQYCFIDVFPATAVGKISKRGLRERLREQYLTG